MHGIRSSYLVGGAWLAALVLASTVITTAAAAPAWEGTAREWSPNEPRAQSPEDAYALAGGCYAVEALDEAGEIIGFVTRTEDGFAATAPSLEGAEPFHFQATGGAPRDLENLTAPPDLGRYLLFGTQEDFLAASEGAAAEVVYSATGSQPGQVAGGVALEHTDEAADAIADSEVNRTTGRGASIEAAQQASDLADWKISGDEQGAGPFAIELPETDQALATGSAGELTLVDAGPGTDFGFELTQGCAEYPEIEVNVEGDVLGGQTFFQEVRGFMDLHLHMMAFEFIGGRVRCGRPSHRFGALYALRDCPDHQPNGEGAVLEGILSNGSPDGRHNTDGWPTFEGWPKPGSLTHEQVYYKWLERAWRGGLRVFTNLLVDNGQLCRVYPYKSSRNRSCNEMDGVRLQARRLYELQDYIDAQSGGPGEGWFRIVTDPFEAREVINEGKLAVVMGIEVSVPLDCGLTLDMPKCDTDDIDERLQEMYDIGVRQMELVNKFDNALAGVTGDAEETGIVVNTGNFGETSRFWQFETCGEHDHPDAHDKRQLNLHEDVNEQEPVVPDELTGRDSIFGAILQASGTSGAAPLYPEGPHCNVRGLSELGEVMISEMAERGMIFDPDHMSARARTQSLDFIENEMDKVHGLPYSGIVSSHSWADDTIYERIYELGGVVTPHAGSATSFVDKWMKHREWADERFYFGFGYGSDVNGFSAQGPARNADAVDYPFEGFGGALIDRQHSGPAENGRTYDIDADGVAHYGLYPDWIEDIQMILGGEQADAFYEDMVRGPEAFLQMWERAIGVAPDTCRSDVEDLTDDQLNSLETGMSTEDVVMTLGQPWSRIGTDFTYCMTHDRVATLTFTSEGSLTTWKRHSVNSALTRPEGPPTPGNRGR